MKDIKNTKHIKFKDVVEPMKFNDVGKLIEEIKISPIDDYSNQIVKSKNLGSFKDGLNQNIISESGFSRFLSFAVNTVKDFAIITAYRYQDRKGNVLTKEQNILRNRKLRYEFNKRKMGVHQLIGHWRECTVKGMDYKSCPANRLVDIVERSYAVVRPNDMDIDSFEKLMLSLTTIDGLTQDAYFLRRDGRNYIVYSNGSKEEHGTDLSIGKIAQAYSSHIGKPDIPFVFEGMELPQGISGRMFFLNEGVEWVSIQD